MSRVKQRKGSRKKTLGKSRSGQKSIIKCGTGVSPVIGRFGETTGAVWPFFGLHLEGASTVPDRVTPRSKVAAASNCVRYSESRPMQRKARMLISGGVLWGLIVTRLQRLIVYL